MPYLDFTTDLVATDWSEQCAHPYWCRAGGNRWRCQRCHKTETRPRIRRQKEEIVKALARCFTQGKSLWTARCETRTNCYYAAKYYNLFRRHPERFPQ